jgi:CMP-N-acetylneuraminic acid synthetase
MKVVAVIPARGGSKGIPRKNLAKLQGHTLTALAVGCACRAGVERVLVSTDDEEIAAVAMAAGAEVPALRPPEISGDTARMVEAALHVIQAAGCRPDAALVVHPASPLRSAADVREAVALLSERSDAAAVVSVARFEEPHPEKVKRIESGWLAPYMGGAVSGGARQELPPAYRLNGALYLVRYSVMTHRRTLLPDKTLPLIMPAERSINIDHPWDLILAETLLQQGKVSLETS